MATQTLKQGRAKTMRISVNGKLAEGISAKDVVLAIIGRSATPAVPAMWWSSLARPSKGSPWKGA